MRVKILYVIGSLDIGGAEGHIVEIVPRLDRSRFEPSIFTLTHAGTLACEVGKNGVRVVTLSQGKLFESGNPIRTATRVLRSMMNLYCFLRKEQPDIVHCYLPLSHFVGGVCGILAGVPIRIMSRRSLNDYQKKYPLVSQLERYMNRWMHRIVANSNAVLHQLVAEGVSERQLRLIYNGVDVCKYGGGLSRTTTRKWLNIAPNIVLIVVVANLIPYKGHEDLLMALSNIREALTTSWKLLCVGKPYCLQLRLEQKAKELGIHSNIQFLGEQRERIPELLFSADIGVLCSHQEGFSNSILEGMAAGLPMVVTDVGGNAEAVIDGETGIIVPPKCPEKLGRAILTLVKDPGKRRCMGAAGRVRVQQLFSVRACVAEYEKLYEELLSEHT
ncbi:MAG: glycosyl transferase [Nitrospirales bacterium]|nr:MAG: glycosyl transferase [Nitrospirales bacterium]